MLERRLDTARGCRGQGSLAHQLAELRKIVDELSPARLGDGHRRSRGPFGLGSPRDKMDELADYFERFARSQERIEAILQTLGEGRLAPSGTTPCLARSGSRWPP